MYLVKIWAEPNKCINFEFNNQADAIEFVSTCIETADAETEISIKRLEER